MVLTLCKGMQCSTLQSLDPFSRIGIVEFGCACLPACLCTWDERKILAGKIGNWPYRVGSEICVRSKPGAGGQERRRNNNNNNIAIILYVCNKVIVNGNINNVINNNDNDNNSSDNNTAERAVAGDEQLQLVGEDTCARL